MSHEEKFVYAVWASTRFEENALINLYSDEKKAEYYLEDDIQAYEDEYDLKCIDVWIKKHQVM
jgi:hypothetical protein